MRPAPGRKLSGSCSGGEAEGRKVTEIGEADGKVLFRQKVRAEVSYTKEDRLIHLSALRRWCVAHRGWKDIGRTS